MDDLRSAEGWEAYLARFAEHRAKLSEREEQEFSSATLYVNRDPLTGEAFATPSAITLIAKFPDASKSKDDFMQIVRATSVVADAFASVYTSEAWMSVVPGTVSEEEAIKQIGGSPSQDPQRREILILMCEHRSFGNQTRVSVIETIENKRRCQPWSTEPLFEGRFAGIVAPRPLNEGIETTLVRTYLKMKIDQGVISNIIALEPADVFN